MKKKKISRLLSMLLSLSLVLTFLLSLGGAALAATMYNVTFYKSGTRVGSISKEAGSSITSADVASFDPGEGRAWSIDGDSIVSPVGTVVNRHITIYSKQIPHSHSYVETGRTEASCTQDGVINKACECGATTTEVIPAGHRPGSVQAEDVIAPGCITDGSHNDVLRCSVCNEILSSAPVTDPATGHTASAPVQENAVNASCTAAGSYEEVVYCSVCSTEMSRTAKSIPATGHSPAAAAAENVVDADCTTPGSFEEVVYCSVCSAEMSRTAKSIPATGHSPAAAVEENVVDADCTTPNSLEEVVYCSVCGDELSRTTKTGTALGHTPSAAVRENESPASCTVKGSYEEVVYCSVCGDELSRTPQTIPLLAHDKNKIILAVPFTCLTDGWTAGTRCSVCDTVTTAPTLIAAPGHMASPTVQENRVEASCTAAGSYEDVVYCSVCSDEMSRIDKTIAKLSHTPEAVPGKAATCTEKGLTDGEKCSVCGTTITAQQEIPVLSHTPEAVPAKAATCTEKGLTEGKKCSVCKEVLEAQAEIPAKGHNFGEWRVTVQPSCVPGTEVRTCSVCSEEESRSIDAVDEHKWNKGEVTTPANCKDEGVRTFTCKTCASTKTAAIATVKTHTDTDKDKICDICGAKIKNTSNYGTSTHPITDDPSNVPLWLAMLCVGICGIAASALMKKRKA